MADQWVKFDTQLNTMSWIGADMREQADMTTAFRRECIAVFKSIDNEIRQQVLDNKLNIKQAGELYAEMGTWLEMDFMEHLTAKAGE